MRKWPGGADSMSFAANAPAATTTLAMGRPTLAMGRPTLKTSRQEIARSRARRVPSASLMTARLYPDSSAAGAHAHGAPVGAQALDLGERLDVGALGAQRRRVVLDDGGALDEVGDAERREEARAAARGQHVARPRHVVAHRLGRVRPEEERARRRDLLADGARVAQRELGVLGREQVHDPYDLVDAVDDDERAVVPQRRLGDLAPGQVLDLPLELGGDALADVAAHG